MVDQLLLLPHISVTPRRALAPDNRQFGSSTLSTHTPMPW
jgi:hypothetical protein